MPAGRPSSYKPEFAKQAEKLCLLGATDQEMADFFEVEVRTIYRWKHEHEEFSHALKSAKEAADERVERSLYQRAIGYEQDEVKIFMPSGAGEPVYAKFRAKVAPDVTAAIFWLKNRRSDAWRDVKHIDGRQQVTHKYDLDSLSDERLAELERILADAVASEGGEIKTLASRIH
jgi:hypothetical protein